MSVCHEIFGLHRCRQTQLIIASYHMVNQNIARGVCFKALSVGEKFNKWSLYCCVCCESVCVRGSYTAILIVESYEALLLSYFGARILTSFPFSEFTVIISATEPESS